LRFLAVLTALLGIVYAYLALGWEARGWERAALAAPFVTIWLVPAVYWVGDRGRHTRYDEWLHFASYVCMGWLSFAFVLTVLRDLALFATGWQAPTPWLLAASVAALGAGAAAAFRGPRVRKVEVPIENLDPALEGLRIVQITDLHVGPTIGERYVRRVVEMANALKPDLVALTGDMVDGPVSRLGRHVAPLAELEPKERRFFILGNHEAYAGAGQWIDYFRAQGMHVLLNEYRTLSFGNASVLVGGVVDPAAGKPDAEKAFGKNETAALRLLLAHNPKLAPLGERAGFDLQLSGHTHAGQFFPWTLAVKLIHGPHVWGLSRSGRMWVYVSAGTGTWGPPVRFGTTPELTLIRLVRRDA